MTTRKVTNITAHPSLSVPAGLSANGVPFGLQITGPRWADDMVLAAGAAWEAAQPWPAADPGYEPSTVRGCSRVAAASSRSGRTRCSVAGPRPRLHLCGRSPPG
ncbi:MAG: amidase family protein [Actinomycetota bacterium]